MYWTVGKKEIVVSSTVYVIFPLLMALKEYALVASSEQPLFLIGRIGVIMMFSVYLVLALFDRRPAHYPIAFYLGGLFYAVHGQYFQPNYWLAMIELDALFPLFFLVDKRTMFGLYAIGVVVFNFAFFHFSGRFIEAKVLSEVLRGDVMIGTFITAAIAFVTYNNLIVARMAKDRLSQRFIDVGKNVTYIIHDLKGMISTPTVYSGLLQRSMEANGYTEKDKTLVRQLKEDLEGIKVFVTETTRLVSAEFSDEDRRQFVKLSESVHMVKTLLKSKLKAIRLNQEGDIEIKAKLELVNRVLINLISNSIDAITERSCDSPEIKVSCKDGTVQITDNSGACLSSDQLKKLNGSGVSFTTKSQGSGLGTMIVKDYIRMIGGQVRYSNGPKGVLVTLMFPQKITRLVEPGVAFIQRGDSDGKEGHAPSS